MKLVSIFLGSLLTVCAITIPSTAVARDFYKGSFSGYAPQSAVDLNGDGIPGRQFSLDVIELFSFSKIEGLVDTAIVSLPPAAGCSNPNAFELEATGTAIFKHRSGNAIFAEVDSSVHLCFEPGQPEFLKMNIIGGFGIFSNATGTIDTVLRDVTLLTDPATGFPQLVYSTGEYKINLD